MPFSLSIDDLEAALRERLLAEANHRAVEPETILLEWLRRGAEVSPNRAPITDAEHDMTIIRELAGSWTKEEARAFHEAIGDLERIDPELWK